MNERIKELASQVGLTIEVMTDDSNRDIECYMDQFGAVPSVNTIHRLAELIVQECAKIVNSMEQYEGQGDCHTAEYIKEHFGVEK